MRPGKTLEATPARAVIHSDDGVVRHMIDGDLHEVQGPLEISMGPKVRIVAIR